MRDKDLYTLALLRYKEENPDIDLNMIFSSTWNLNKNYKLKTSIITNAIMNHVMIEDTELYKKHFSKIKKI